MHLTKFPDSLPVSIRSRELFQLAYRNSPPSSAALAFSTLFGWQEYFNYQYSCFEDLLVVHCRSLGRASFLPPLLLSGRLDDGDWPRRLARFMRAASAWCAENRLEPVFGDFPGLYVRRLPCDTFSAVPERDSFEYVYRRSDLEDLPGRPYAGKRNLVRQFERNNDCRYEPLTPETLPLMRDFVKTLAVPSGASAGLAAGEGRMIERLLDHFTFLKLQGGLLFVNGRAVAATLSAIVRDFACEDGAFPTAVVHSEDALVEYKGVFQAINQLFCRHLPPEVVYVDREEDLGITGLRKAKLSYHPARFIEKSRVSLKQAPVKTLI
ncbi:MAG: DUF2156 domain-containing protein [Endomicrobiales bacterium]